MFWKKTCLCQRSAGFKVPAPIKNQTKSPGFGSAGLWWFWVPFDPSLTGSCTGFYSFHYIVFYCIYKPQIRLASSSLAPAGRVWVISLSSEQKTVLARSFVIHKMALRAKIFATCGYMWLWLHPVTFLYPTRPFNAFLLKFCWKPVCSQQSHTIRLSGHDTPGWLSSPEGTWKHL